MLTVSLLHSIGQQEHQFTYSNLHSDFSLFLLISHYLDIELQACLALDALLKFEHCVTEVLISQHVFSTEFHGLMQKIRQLKFHPISLVSLEIHVLSTVKLK